MADVGAGAKKPDLAATELDFSAQDSAANDASKRQVSKQGSAEKDREARLETQKMIERHFSPKAQIQLDTDAQIEAILADSSQLEPLLEHLCIVNELEKEDLEPIRAHYGLSAEVKKIEELKKQAAIDEDYENAAKYKKQIVELKQQALTVEKLKEQFLNRLPTLSVRSMFELLNEIDPVFTRSFLVQIISNKNKRALKMQVLHKLTVLQEMTRGDKGLGKVKSSFEDTM